MKIKTQLVIKIVLITFCISMSAIYIYSISVKQHDLDIWVFDTAGSPSILIRTPEDKRILVNGGSSNGIVRELTRVLPFYSKKIDMLIATEDKDKYTAGLYGVTERFSVGSVYLSEYSTTTEQISREFLKLTKRKNISTARLIAGQVIEVDKDVSLHVLFPVSPQSFKYSNASPPQLVFSVTYGSSTVVIGGKPSEKIRKFVNKSSSTTPQVLVLNRSVTISNKEYKLKEIGALRIRSDGANSFVDQNK